MLQTALRPPLMLGVRRGETMSLTETIVVALIGGGGVVVGAVLSIAGQFALHWFQERG